MGRKLLLRDNQSIVLHPFLLSLSLSVTGIVAIFALISSLCALRQKHKLDLTTSQGKPNEKLKIETSTRNDEKTVEENVMAKMGPPVAVAVGSDGTDEAALPLPLPPPPGKNHQIGSMSFHNRSSSLSSLKKSFFSSMSLKMHGVGTWSRQKSKVLNHEDSILKKKIILGEKCRVPDEDDTILIDDNGHRISTYHPRTPSSLPVSRQTSFIDPEAVQGSISMADKIYREG